MFAREWLRYLPSEMGGSGGPQAKVYTVFLWYVLEICGGLGGKGMTNKNLNRRHSGKQTHLFLKGSYLLVADIREKQFNSILLQIADCGEASTSITYHIMVSATKMIKSQMYFTQKKKCYPSPPQSGQFGIFLFSPPNCPLHLNVIYSNVTVVTRSIKAITTREKQNKTENANCSAQN